MTRYNVGDKIKIRDNITYYDTGLNKVDHSNLYDRILTVCNVFKVDNNILIQVEEDKIHLLKPEWIEHIEENSNGRPHLIAISFEPDRVVGEVYVNCHINNTVELNYPEYNNNESAASIAHKVINELFPDEEYVAKVNTKVKLEGKEKEWKPEFRIGDIVEVIKTDYWVKPGMRGIVVTEAENKDDYYGIDFGAMYIGEGLTLNNTLTEGTGWWMIKEKLHKIC